MNQCRYDIISRKEYKSESNYEQAMRNRGAIMITTIRNLLHWCHEKYTLNTKLQLLFSKV